MGQCDGYLVGVVFAVLVAVLAVIFGIRKWLWTQVCSSNEYRDSFDPECGEDLLSPASNSTENPKTSERLQTLQQENAALKAEVKKEKGEKEDALRRLSALMSSRLRDGNPNVVDLSDTNRPLKVGEQFSELYDNQWTEAFTELLNVFGENKTEQSLVEMLLKILQECYQVCKEKADEQIGELNKHLAAIAGIITKMHSSLSDDLFQRIKEERKMFALESIPDYNMVCRRIEKLIPAQGVPGKGVLDGPPVAAYVKECLKLCHLMVNQDPSMSIGVKIDTKTKENFKAYQTRGNQVAFVVWPALYLQDGGALVSKGVAEFKN